jgi:sugar O-acyltransferase (sialic acid O-acetyltransferase NeuD family)
MAQPLIIYGATYLEPLKVLAAINARAPRFELVGFLDDNPSLARRTIVGVPVLGGRDQLSEYASGSHVFFHNVGGNPRASVEVAQLMHRAGCRLTSLVHPGVQLDGVELGHNCFVPDGCVLGYGCRLGDFVACRLGVLVSHAAAVGNNVSLSVRATVAGHSVIEDECFLGASSTVVQVRIGRGSIVGAGAVVLHDIAPGSTVVGIPAKPIAHR